MPRMNAYTTKIESSNLLWGTNFVPLCAKRKIQKGVGKKNKWYFSACAKSIFKKESHALVKPHPGHGIEKRMRKGQPQSPTESIREKIIRCFPSNFIFLFPAQSISNFCLFLCPVIGQNFFSHTLSYILSYVKTKNVMKKGIVM